MKMSSNVIYVVLLLRGLSIASVIHIEANPNNVVIGMTRYLEVKCSITRGRGFSMDSLISIIISRSTNTELTNFKELASLTMFIQQVQIKDVSELNVLATGKIDNNGESYISLVWEYPDATKSGIYQCEAHGVDQTGHPAFVNSTVVVSNSRPDIESLAGEIKSLASMIEHLTYKMDILMHGQLLLTNWRDSWMSVAENMLFEKSFSYIDRRYLLSKTTRFSNSTNEESVCNFFGGYLLEIDTEEEHNFIITNVTSLAHGFARVHFSPTNEGHLNVWKNRHSNTTVTYFKWDTGYPTMASNLNCLILSPPTWLMREEYCNYFSEEYSGYICEVPLN
ncbi:uncharacterized protein LOC131934584 [Physella acuta]|uniref:uncharacterized protein LOC131934584 n=1 Tax=Physella acuta TaxID=109671 RepID=UPI0027DBB6F3|nr:uncharacterized protein LOC131934584 [Physella acuta]